jgi:hypothetical protein
VEETNPASVIIEKEPIIKLKRIPVRMSFILKKEDSLTLLINVYRTKSGEIFRVLFYVMLDHNLKNAFYVDKKLKGTLDEDTATALDVASVNEWNSQSETCIEADFEKKILDYFANFKMYQLPPVVATRNANRDWLSAMLKKAPHMKSITPVLIEEILKEGLGVTDEQIRDEILPQIKPDKRNMFYEIEKDKLLWKLVD